jgi:hypothetical protein
MLTATLVVMFCLVVPITSSFRVTTRDGQEIKRAATLPYYTDSLMRSLVQNTRNAWENEPDCAFFSLKTCLPFSIARTLGLILCWCFIFILIYLLVRRKKIRAALDSEKRIAFSFFGLWLVIDILALGLIKESDPRHLMAPLIPLVVFFAAASALIQRQINRRIGIFFTVLLLSGWVYAAVTNMGHQIYWRKYQGGLEIAQDRYLNYIYADYKGKPLSSYAEMIDFMGVPQQRCAWWIPFIADELYGHFPEKIRPEAMEKTYRQYGQAYIVTTDPGLIPGDRRYKKCASFDGTDHSYFNDWVLKFRKKKGNTYTVYKFVPS